MEGVQVKNPYGSGKSGVKKWVSTGKYLGKSAMKSGVWSGFISAGITWYEGGSTYDILQAGGVGTVSGISGGLGGAYVGTMIGGPLGTIVGFGVGYGISYFVDKYGNIYIDEYRDKR